MSINLSSHLGPIIVCKPNEKKGIWDIPGETLYLITDESETTSFRDNHVYAPNRYGYSLNAATEIGQLIKLQNCKIILEKFKNDFGKEIKLISDYYGSNNIEIFIALYSYYN